MKHVIELLVIVITSIAGAFAFSCNWNWFVVPLLDSPGRIGTVHAMGLMTLSSIVIVPIIWHHVKTDETNHPFLAALFMTLGYLLELIMGVVLMLFMKG